MPTTTEKTMAEKILLSEKVVYTPFAIPGATNDKLFAKVLNVDLTDGPVVAELKMDAGAFIPQHFHEKTEEQIYVLEGTFTNNGIDYPPGTFFSVRKGEHHGPHKTKDGCRILFIQPKEVNPTDFFIVNE